MYPCQRQTGWMPRRDFLSRWGLGLGGIALADLLHRQQAQAATSGILKRLHHPPRATSVIFLYMDGGPGQMDTFDPKPALQRWHGKPFPTKREPTQFDNVGNTLASPWNFRQYGESGLWISDLFPHVAEVADELCVIRSMTSKFSEHTSANYFLHTGLGVVGRPSMGAWAVYGLGTEAEDLPGFVVLNGGLIPPGGLDNFASGFLPAAYQGSIFSPTGDPIANLRSSSEAAPRRIAARRHLLRQLDRQYADRTGHADPVESAIRNYELAYQMQQSVPEASDLSSESESTLAMYGVGSSYQPTDIFARECLLARRLVERGVRFIELTCPSVSGDRWDQHSNLKNGHENNARAVDQPIAALIGDLRQRGLLDQTLIVWGGEFGRTPFAQGTNGRDHNPFAFTMWMAGGGVRGGTVYGQSDEFGYKVVDKPVEIHDLHATILYLLGVDHERLTFRFGGRDHRLTDVHGHVLHDIIA
ncbi:MAG: sulfatase [Pirellulaceae bacterium]|nr:MAG: sulfatase [Pirellulaceae bacterium]